MPKLDLFVHDQHVGVVEPAARSKTRVTLEVARNFPQTVPLSESFRALPGRRAASDAVSNFLGGYVPEGNHRERMAAKRRVDPGDLFALLTEFGGSIAGAVSLRQQNEAQHCRPAYEPLPDEVLETRLKQALEDSDQGIPDDSRSALPGYQPKVLAALFDSQWMYPHGRAHSTHILKPQVPARPHRIFDEHYSHLVARRIGLSRYDSRIHTAGMTTFLAIERFDRTIVDDRVVLHHQEDLAQALGLDWRDTDVKFQEPDWPTDPRRATARRIGELLGSIPGGGAAVEAWIRQMTYNVAIGNNDAHAKNVALLHLTDGTVLSPIYDALPNLFQDGLVKWDLALAIDGIFDHRRVSTERLLAEIDTWRVIPAARAAVIIENTLAELDEALGSITPPPEVSPGMVERLQLNTARLVAGEEIGQHPGAAGS